MLRSAKSIGELIKYYRTINGYSQQTLADKIHVTVAAVSGWERGISKPGVDVATNLAKDMRISLDEFYTIHLPTQSETYSINDEMNLGRAFFNVYHYDILENPLRVEITFEVRGLTVYEDFIDENLRVFIESKSHTYAPQSTVIKEIDSYVSKMSPELEQFPIHAKIYCVQKTFKIDKIEPFMFAINFNGNHAHLEVSDALSNFIHKRTPVHKSSIQDNLDQLKSEVFLQYLEYLTRSKGFSYLRDIILEHYEYLAHLIKK